MGDYRSFDDVLIFAISRETEAIQLYEALAKTVTRPETREILHNLAFDEMKHKMKLEALRDGAISITPEEIGGLNIPDDPDCTEPHNDMTYVELLLYAMNRERQSYQLYSHMAKVVEDEQTKELFRWLACQEEQHRLGLEIEYDLATF